MGSLSPMLDGEEGKEKSFSLDAPSHRSDSIFNHALERSGSQSTMAALPLPGSNSWGVIVHCSKGINGYHVVK